MALLRRNRNKPSEDYSRYVKDGLNFATQQTQDANALLSPYSEFGMSMAPALGQYAMQTIMNPQGYYDEMMSGYSTSPAAQAQMAASQEAALNAASASGGLGGTNMFNQIQQDSQGIMSQDAQQYMDNLMRMQMTGLGVGQNLYGTGFDASSMASQNLNRLGMAGLGAYSGMGQAAQADALARNRNLGVAGGLLGSIFF